MRVHERGILPSSDALGVKSPRLRDIFRLAWWSAKSSFRNCRIWAAFAVTGLFAAGYTIIAGIELGFAHPITWLSLEALPVAFSLGQLLASFLVWVWFYARPNVRIYLSNSRRAVIVLKASERDGCPDWEFTQHLAARRGKGLGRELRKDFAPALKELVDARCAVLWGKAANAAVQDLYIEQFEEIGLVRVGSLRVQYPSPALHVGQSSRETDTRDLALH